MELFSLKDTAKEFRIALVRGLGFDVDEEGLFVLQKDGKPVEDPFVKKQVRLDNLAMIPGSTIILDNNPVSIASYMQEHRELD